MEISKFKDEVSTPSQRIFISEFCCAYKKLQSICCFLKDRKKSHVTLRLVTESKRNEPPTSMGEADAFARGATAQDQTNLVLL